MNSIQLIIFPSILHPDMADDDDEEWDDEILAKIDSIVAQHMSKTVDLHDGHEASSNLHIICHDLTVTHALDPCYPPEHIIKNL